MNSIAEFCTDYCSLNRRELTQWWHRNIFQLSLQPLPLPASLFVSFWKYCNRLMWIVVTCFGSNVHARNENSQENEATFPINSQRKWNSSNYLNNHFFLSLCFSHSPQFYYLPPCERTRKKLSFHFTNRTFCFHFLASNIIRNGKNDKKRERIFIALHEVAIWIELN